MRRVEGTMTRPTQDLTHLNEQPTNKSTITISEVLPKEQGFRAPHQGPSPGILHQEDKPLQHLVLEARRAWVQESKRAVGNRLSCLRDMQISYTLRPRTEAAVWKKPGLDLYTDLREAPKRQEITLRAQCWWHPFWGCHSTTRTLLLAMPFWDPPYIDY